MIPGIDPRMMRQAMKRMGIKEEHIDALQVIIRCADKEFIFDRPAVSKVNMMGQETYQIVGEPVERPLDTEPEINEEDLKTVMEQTGVSEIIARAAIEKHKGDLAAAILSLQEEKE